MAVTESVCLSDEQQAVAVREVAQVYELIKTQQPLLLVHQQPQQLAHGLLNHAMRALNVALSVMNQPHASSSSSAAAAAGGHHFPVMTMIKAESTPANSPAADVSDNHVAGKARRSSPAKRRRINCEDKSSWVYHTVVPHEDGYQWRKYGEKKIQGTHFTRSYFRCTYRDDRGCQATKQIQQEDKNDPPMFQVTYSNEHTCTTTRLINNTNNNPAALHSLTANPNGHPDDDSDDTILTKMIKQEQQAAWLPSPPPDLTTISNNFDETPGLHVSQEVPPCSSNSSAISHYADEFDHHQMGQQLETTVMEEALGLGADLDDPYFYDPNLLLIYENLMNCY
ncbi:probable WRKY transcription factor 14 isoform X1 [Oryza sativa Japonica Group]|uniref:WRKY domain-containing protein n=2 Tax=Oryza sativa subsp. japonica TaxID=39947 RepID=A0A8J8YNT6_ORYSJ|nr:probable WRKY transcription factor 69 isoform X1 [Oryza sativa Japonica Group]ABA96294.1 WRKY DNA binding domain containing protein, expressed [Oryza sativa Japonica Group]EAZ19443.1 hypothetical protein OsJ_35004 [Oryza sativa Japonica Group]KAF2906339.1 hypothetical protein DAI22_12g012300 [Oryza sativa Japonica Group]